MRFIAFISSFLFPFLVFAQSDSLWQTEVMLAYNRNIIPSNGRPYSLYQFEMSFKKNSIVVLPSFQMKSLNNLLGYQAGIDLYKKWSWGYGHTSLYYSPSIIFPSIIWKGNAFFKFKEKFEFQSGINTAFYANREVYALLGGASYYHKRLMFNYNIVLYLESQPVHRVMFRNYLRSSRDFFQLAYYRGADVEDFLGQPIDYTINTFQCSLHKTIWMKTQIQFSLAMLRIYKLDGREQYLNFRVALKRTF